MNPGQATMERQNPLKELVNINVVFHVEFIFNLSEHFIHSCDKIDSHDKNNPRPKQSDEHKE